MHVVSYGAIAFKKRQQRQVNPINPPVIPLGNDIDNDTSGSGSYNNVEENEPILTTWMEAVNYVIFVLVSIPFFLAIVGYMEFGFVHQAITVVMIHFYSSVLKPGSFFILKIEARRIF